ncbi:MAG: orotate phosphoribosyltransferase [Oscillospiraceae bacterium]|nr:orotate phosphoribosyltransferase [Oscillospiraceae bacterium]
MKKTVAGLLLDIQAVYLRPNDPFTWASGIKSPIYCDNRLVLSYPAARDRIEAFMAEMIAEQYPTVEVLAGTSTGGIGHAALAAKILNLPMAYVRATAKEHGRENLIEGRVLPGQKVVVVEDLISTGGSVLEVVETLRTSDAEVLGVASIFSYEMIKADDNFAKANTKYVALSGFSSLIEVALERGEILESDIMKLLAFQANPSDTSWQQQ